MSTPAQNADKAAVAIHGLQALALNDCNDEPTLARRVLLLDAEFARLDTALLNADLIDAIAAGILSWKSSGGTAVFVCSVPTATLVHLVGRVEL